MLGVPKSRASRWGWRAACAGDRGGAPFPAGHGDWRPQVPRRGSHERQRQAQTVSWQEHGGRAEATSLEPGSLEHRAYERWCHFSQPSSRAGSQSGEKTRNATGRPQGPVTTRGAVRVRTRSPTQSTSGTKPRPQYPINANHLASAICWPDTGQASSGTFHVTFLPPRLSQDAGLLPVALRDEKQAPGGEKGSAGDPHGRGRSSGSHRAQQPERGREV